MIVVPAVIFMLFVTLGRSSPRTSSLFSHTKTFLKRFPLYCSSSPISSAPSSPKNFIKAIIEADIAALKNDGRVLTRFPPEPNGYLHLGHAKSICFNFGVAKEYNGATNMRFDDTNPAKEDIEYVNSILTDVKWLVGAYSSSSSSSSSSNGEGTSDAVPWNGPVRHASDYFQTIYDAAINLIETGQAYVDDSTPEQLREMRGTLTSPGVNSPYRGRSVEENLALFRAMKEGQFPDGHCILRAKIDMSSPNLNLRDPPLYRIKRAVHPITGNQWCIYPMYDFAHVISDAVEEITHSLCTLEFADHRPLYDWFIDTLLPSKLLPCTATKRPTQIEFSRLNLQYTVLSKRKLIQLVQEKHVDGWNDPRMPTISGIRRRGYPASAIRLFCERIGISKAENNIDISVLEDCAREILDEEAPRLLGVLDPLKVIITDYIPSQDEDVFVVEKHPKRSELGQRRIPFSKEIFIDREDFFDTGMNGENPVPAGFKRLLLGGQVRLKYAYVITCNHIHRDEEGKVCQLDCTYDPNTRAGVTPEGSKRVKGIIQWVSASLAVPFEAHLYDRLFTVPSPGKDQPDNDFLLDLNPNSVEIYSQALAEPSILDCAEGEAFQLERLGYFCIDKDDMESTASPDAIEMKKEKTPLKVNRVVTLKDTWASRAAPLDSSSSSSSSSAKHAPVKDVSSLPEILRVELRVGKITSATLHPDADSLYIESVDCGEEAGGVRTIISGLAKFIPIDSLIGRKVVVVCNLKPSKMRGVVSEGMLLAASNNVDGEEVVELLEAPEDSKVGDLLQIEGLEKAQPDAVLKSKTQQDMYKRVSALFRTNGEGEATFDGKKFLTSEGNSISVATLKNAPIR